jgi:hypothetical protein
MHSSGKVIAVIGPPRSCTSGTAKGFHHAGFPMGNRLVTPDHGNPEGYYEDWPLVHVNDAMIKGAGGVWRDHEFVQRCQVDTSGINVQRAVEYIHMRSAGGGNWGMKDPRLVLTWPVWRRAFAEFPWLEVIEVFVKRAPHRVAASNHRLDKLISEEEWAVLAAEYHRRMHALIGA